MPEDLKKVCKVIKDKLLNATEDMEIPIVNNGGAVKIIRYTTKGGNVRVGLRFEPSGSFRNAMVLNREEHVSFLETISKNAKLLKELLKTVIEVNEELETISTVKTVTIDDLLKQIK